MVAFRTKKLTRADIGETLRRGRKVCGYSLCRAASRAGISEKTAAALEAGAFDTIRGTVYVRRFIARYAEALALDPQSLLTHIPKCETHTLRVPLREKRPLFTPLCFKFALGGMIAVAVLAYVGFEWHTLRGPPRLALASPSDGAIVWSATVEVAGTTEPTAILEINGARVANGGDGTFAATVRLRRGANTITVTAARKHGRSRTEVRQVMYSPKISSLRHPADL